MTQILNSHSWNFIYKPINLSIDKKIIFILFYALFTLNLFEMNY